MGNPPPFLRAVGGGDESCGVEVVRDAEPPVRARAAPAPGRSSASIDEPSSAGDFTVRTPAGPEDLEIVSVRYAPLATGAEAANDATSGVSRG